MYLGVKLGEHEFKFEGGSEDHCRQMYREWRRTLFEQFGIMSDEQRVQRAAQRDPTTIAPINRTAEGAAIHPDGHTDASSTRNGGIEGG